MNAPLNSPPTLAASARTHAAIIGAPDSIELQLEDSGGSTLDLYRVERYGVEAVTTPAQWQAYDALFEQTYRALGFPLDALRPEADSRCFLVTHDGQPVATFRLTPVTDVDSHYHRLLPRRARRDGSPLRLLELNNVIVAPRFRATIVLGLLLRHSALFAAECDYDYIVGLTRYQILRHFVEFGVVPVDHEPLHLLGRDDLLDFVIYYDTASRDSCDYIEQRARRYFHQQFVLHSIDEKYGIASRRRASAQRRSAQRTAPPVAMPPPMSAPAVTM
ncbi:MAG: hypothetical protein ACREVL_05230 [Solimonas sp.]